MALLKERTNTETGIVTTYHRIDSVSLSNNTLTCFVESYTNKDYRLNGSGVETNHYRFGITVEEEESMGIRQLAYGKIKALSEWEGAEDC